MATATEQPTYEARLPELMASVRSVLRRRWRALALVAGAVFLIGLVLIMLMRPQFAAVAQLRIDPSRNPLQSVQTAQQQQQASLGSELIDTESSVISSPETAREVVRRLHLERDPEFGGGNDGNGPRLSEEERINVAAGRVLNKLSVGREKLTYIINIAFRSRSADTAARVANAFGDVYIQTRTGSQMNTASTQASFFRDRLEALGRDAREAEERVAQFRAANGIVRGGTDGSGAVNITDQQVAPLSNQLATADSEAASARSNLEVARGQIAHGGIDAISAVRSSPVIADLRRQRAEVLRNLDEIGARYGDRHPATIQAREQLAGLDQQIQAEARRTVGSLEADASAAQARADSLRGALRGLESQQGRNTRAAAIADSLQRDADSKRAALDRMSQLSLESTQAERNSIAQAELVDRAVAPLYPAAPNRNMLAVFALVVGLAAGLATIIVQEMLVSGLQTIRDVEDRFGLPVLAAVPEIKMRGADAGVSPAALVIRDATSMYAETLRMIRTSLAGTVREDGSPVQVVALTSATPGEGKTTTALALARVMAMGGHRTLLIDCDLRRAQLRELVGFGERPGTVEYLRGDATFEQAIARDEVENLDVMAVAAPHFSAEDLFGTPRLAELIEQARGRYQYVLIDLPPVMGVADARTVASQADYIALLIKWSATPVKAVEHTLSALRTDNAPVGGAVYTMVDPTAEAMGTLYYAADYASYYSGK